MAPKRYAGVYYSKPDKPDQVPKPGGKEGELWARIDTKGAESVRRDNAPLVSNAVATVLRLILAERKPLDAITYVAGLVDDLRTGRVDRSQLIVSKALSKEPRDYDPMPVHAKLTLKMRERDPATAPRVGDRVPYILVPPPPDKNAKVSDCGEDPEWLLKHDVPIDSAKYVDMLRKAMERILDRVAPGATKLVFDGDATKRTTTVTLASIFAGGPREPVLDPTSQAGKEQAKKKKKKPREKSDHEPSNRTLEWARSKSRIELRDVAAHVARFLAERRKQRHDDGGGGGGAGLQHRFVETASSSSPVLRAGVARVVAKCLGCGQSLQDCATCGRGRTCDCEERAAKPLCSRCAAKPGEREKHDRRAADRLAEARALNDERWRTCEDCAGSIEQAEDCSFKVCENWFARAASRKELGAAEATCARFGQ